MTTVNLDNAHGGGIGGASMPPIATDVSMDESLLSKTSPQSVYPPGGYASITPSAGNGCKCVQRLLERGFKFDNDRNEHV